MMPSSALDSIFPAGFVAAIAENLGSTVMATERLYGGFSGNANCLVTLDDGRRAVVKTAVHGAMMAASAVPWTDIIHREIWMYRNLENTATYRPAYLGEVDADGWLGLIIEHIGDASRVPPWTDETIEGTARGLAALHRLPKPPGLPVDVMKRTIRQPYYERIKDRNRAPGRLPPSYCTGAFWDWFDVAYPDLLAAHDEFFGPLPAAFCHNDVRSDNMFYRDGKPIFLDWNQVVWSTPARDSVYWAVGVEREGGPRAPEVFRRYLAAGGTHPTDAAVRGTLSWWFGHSIDWLQNDAASLPPLLLRIDQNPTILRWLVELLDLPRPPVAI